MAKILIKGGTLYTMTDDEKNIFQGDILLENGKIKAVAEQIEDADAEIIDAAGCYVLPGLIDAHSHIGLFDFNHDKSVDDANEMTDPVSAAVDARYGMNPKARELKVAYEHGITSILFTPGSGDVFCGQPFVGKTYGDNIFEMTVKAPAAVKIALGGNPKNTFGDMKRLPMTRMGVAHVLWDTLRKAKEYLDKKEKGEKQPYDANMEAIIPALRGEIPCKIHCTQYDMLTAIEVAKAYGVRFSLEHAWGATDYLDEIAESGCDICYGPIATYRSPGERRKVDVEAVKMLDDRGVNVAIITDSPILSEESLYHHIGEAVREGLSQERAVRMVTINPARQLGLEDRLGSLEAGKDADVIVMKGRLGLDTDAKVLYTIMDGNVIYRREV
ncbi:amidohydrolase family protein [Faecalicatena sp. Marseille-Q4148]|nr:amidohydrolase family protein [Faecalicatena sp. Marseille-Q4148]